MSDPFKKWRKKWPNWPEPYKHADLLLKDVPLNSPNVVMLEKKKEIFATMPDELKQILRELGAMWHPPLKREFRIKAVYFEDGVC